MREAINVIKQEIKWHKEHRGKATPEYEEGFLAGLKQLLDLLLQLKELQKEE